MTLKELFSESSEIRVEGESSEPVTELCYDSRRVRPGALFFAIRGEKSDGHEFVKSAIAKGARSVVVDRSLARSPGVTFVHASDVRRAMGIAASAFYGHPGRSMMVVGVTGTNGKTTTSYLLESIWAEGGHPVGVIGTINYRYGGKRIPAPHTTPESVDLQALLAEMKNAGVTHVVLEVSSHALALERVRGLELDGAVFTNLSRDHLDFHEDLDDYFLHKSRLFSDYLAESPKPARFSVVNTDDPRSPSLLQVVQGRLVTYGMTVSSTVHPLEWEADLHGLSGALAFSGEAFRFSSSLVGEVNLRNILAAAAAAWGSGAALEEVQRGIKNLRCVPGRMDRVNADSDLTVFVDYAHTPDALEKVIRTLRPLAPTRIVTVFGCGGDRDRGKRPLMGGIAASLSDLTILTSDNPRSENPHDILREIEEGIREEGLPPLLDPRELESKERGYLKIEDRRQAILLAVQHARPGDTLLIAGKGHEAYQLVGAERKPFDDREEARKALEKRGRGGAG